MQVHEGRPEGHGRRVAVAVARFNEPVTSRLLEGALEALRGAGVADEAIEVVPAPGAFELPLAADALAASDRFDAVVALGAVIRGETGHYDYVCKAATDGLLRVGLEQGIPVLFGVLTCDDGDQAFARAGGAKGNKGADCALDALRMIDVLERIQGLGAGVESEGGAA